MKVFKNFLIINLIVTVILYIWSYYMSQQPSGTFAGLDPRGMISVLMLLGAMVLTGVEAVGIVVYFIFKRKIRYAIEEKQKEKIYEQWRREAAGEDISKQNHPTIL